MIQMHMILEHEMNHIRNRDLLWKRFYLAVLGIHWFNPLVYLLAKKEIYLEEVICDRQSVEHFLEEEAEDRMPLPGCFDKLNYKFSFI